MAVVKAGAFGIVRVVYDVFGVEFCGELGVATPLAIAAAVTILYGSLRAVYQNDLKRRLAYSTISQVSYIALGAAIVGPLSTVGGIVHLVHQGLMKITLFFAAGNLAETLGIHKVSELDGVGRRMPWTMAAFTVAALGMIGVPPMAGFVTKWLLGSGAIAENQWWVIGVLAGSTALNAIYFLPIVYAAWFKDPDGPWPHDHGRGRFETHLLLLIPPVVTAVSVVLVGLLASMPFSPLDWCGSSSRGSTDRERCCSLLLTIVFPLMLIAAWPIPSMRVRVRCFTAWTPLPALLLSVFATDFAVDLPWLLFGSRLGLDTTGRLFLAFTSVLWLAAGVYAHSYLARDSCETASIFFTY